MIRSALKLIKFRKTLDHNLLAYGRRYVRCACVTSDITKRLENNLIKADISRYSKPFKSDGTYMHLLALGLIVANCSKKGNEDEEAQTTFSKYCYITSKFHNLMICF